jgi:hypothetical protein
MHLPEVRRAETVIRFLTIGNPVIHISPIHSDRWGFGEEGAVSERQRAG